MEPTNFTMSITTKLTKKQLYKIATIKNIKGRSTMNKPKLLTKIREHYLTKKYFQLWYENAVNINNLESFVQIDTEDNGKNHLKYYQEPEKMIAVKWNQKNKKLDEIMMREYRCRYEELHYKKSLFWVDIAKKKFNYKIGKKMQLFTKMGYSDDYFTVYHCEEPRKYNDIWIGEDGIISLGCYNYPTEDEADLAYVSREWPDIQFKIITDVTHLANEKWLRDIRGIVENFDIEEEEDLCCIKCKTKIKENSKEHDYCILVNDGEDLVCVDCADK